LAFSLLLLLLLQAFSWKRSSRLYQRENGVIISLEKQTHDKKRGNSIHGVSATTATTGTLVRGKQVKVLASLLSVVDTYPSIKELIS
jgi:hypothetical protein